MPNLTAHYDEPYKLGTDCGTRPKVIWVEPQYECPNVATLLISSREGVEMLVCHSCWQQRHKWNWKLVPNA